MAHDDKQGNPDSMLFWQGGLKQIDDLVQNVKNSSSAVGASSGSEKRNAVKNIVSVALDKEAIKKRAEEIASWKNPYDVSVWLFAEAETRLADAYVTVLDGTSASVQIDASKVVESPSREATDSLARAIYARRPGLPELHWFLAERRYIYEKVKGA
ncbi:MAG: hypothetical protein GYA24_18805 [Candidatus Lokiarchaeota archaeon]|nr:hypothetical protein [Candidatus Lokiarchaeota archaeon]